MTLRAAAPDDDPFLATLYATTRADELAPTGWDDARKAAFCDSQFRLQATDYASRFPVSGHKIIVRDGERVGRVWVAPQPEHVLLVDIAILPEHQRLGIGTAVVGGVIADAARLGVPVRVTALRTNHAALAFYERLGFAPVADDAVYVLLERATDR